jgi:two-component system sensor histidine kinase KdpD
MASRHAPSTRPVEAAFALPVGFTALLLVAAASTQAAGRISSGGVLTLVCLAVGATCAIAEPLAAIPLWIIGWLTATSFSGPPYGQLQTTRWLRTAIVIGVVAGLSVVAGAATRTIRGTLTRYVRITDASQFTIDTVPTARSGTSSPVDNPGDARTAGARIRAGIKTIVRPPGLDGISRRRLVTGVALTAGGLPVLTTALTAFQPHLALVDDLLLYLAAVVAVTLVGGFWPAVIAALASSLLLNWFFTPPVHTWTIEAPQNLLALLLFVTVAVTVSSVVHLAARRAALSAHLAAESNTMLRLAQTVLAGNDTPQAVLDHLRNTVGYSTELVERVGQRWVRVAGTPGHTPVLIVRPRADLEMRVHAVDADTGPLAANGRVLDAFAAQAAAALDRERLRIQAAQAEGLAEGNRMRTALLAAVSHDLRTPLASVKASVSTLRQTDVRWSPGDQAELLATIEEGADRLNTLISNLLDMSRIQTGALQPFVRPTALDEVAPVVLGGIDGAGCLDFAMPEDLPLLAADPGLLERVLANLVANALRYSPSNHPPTLAASAKDGTVTIDVIDHGPGVPVDQRDLILQPFEQLGDQRSSTGVGLGLAVAKGFVEVMGGQLSAITTPGGGLTMRVELPASAAVVDPAGRPGTQP